MKKTLFLLCMMFFSGGSLWSQCIPTCSNYAFVPITFTTFPVGIGNAVTQFTPNLDDGATPSIPLGFNFNFYCNTYTAISVCSNGFIKFDDGIPISFGAPAVSHPPQSFPNALAPNGIVALNMADLDVNMGGSITYGGMGVSPNQKFIITYSNVPMWNFNSSLNTGQIVLNETSNTIEIHTESVNNSNTSFYPGSQGIENNSASNGVNIPGRTQTTWSATSSAYAFLPYTPLPPSSISGSSVLCHGVVSSYMAAFIIGATAYHWTMPNGWQGTSTISAMTATAGHSSGNLSVTATYTCGTSAPALFNVSVIPSPTVLAGQVTPISICAGKTITLNPSGAISYTIYPGGLIGTPPFTDNPPVTTTYSISGTNSLGCESFNTPTVTATVKQTPFISVNSGSICLGQTFSITPVGNASIYSVTGNSWNVSPTLAAEYSYSVTGTGTSGCISNLEVSTLTVHALPIVTAASSRSVICRYESTVLTATGALSYLWSNQSTNFSVTTSPTNHTIYMVTGTDMNGCKNSATLNITVNPCTAIEDVSNNGSGIKVYPNPSHGSFDLRLSSLVTETQIEIYNTLGQAILIKRIEREITSINLSAFSNGLYYIKVKNAASEEIIKLVKQ